MTNNIIRLIKPHKSKGYDIDCNVYKMFFIKHYPKYKIIISESYDNFLDENDKVHIYVSSFDKKVLSTSKAQYKMLMINYELFLHDPTDADFIKYFNYILCRTEIGYEWANKMKQKHNFKYELIYTKFTSLFPVINEDKTYNMILHSAGEHHWKQTDIILKTWIKYDDLPLIIITCTGQCYKNIKELIHDKNIKNMYVYDEKTEYNKLAEISMNSIDTLIKDKSTNIILCNKLLEYSNFIKLKNSIALHLCPSIIEGYGHYLNEARKIGAFVITVDYPPMNELITKDTGVLIKCNSYGKKRNETDLCFITEESLYETIKHTINLDIDIRKEMIKKSNQKFIDDTTFFNKSMNDFFNKLL